MLEQGRWQQQRAGARRERDGISHLLMADTYSRMKWPRKNFLPDFCEFLVSTPPQPVSTAPLVKLPRYHNSWEMSPKAVAADGVEGIPVSHTTLWPSAGPQSTGTGCAPSRHSCSARCNTGPLSFHWGTSGRDGAEYFTLSVFNSLCKAICILKK